MIARVFVMNINNADDLLATDQRSRQERFVGVFWRGGKGLKARVFPGARRQRHNRLVFRSPSRYAFSDPQITKSESYIFVCFDYRALQLCGILAPLMATVIDPQTRR